MANRGLTALLVFFFIFPIGLACPACPPKLKPPHPPKCYTPLPPCPPKPPIVQPPYAPKPPIVLPPPYLPKPPPTDTPCPPPSPPKEHPPFHKPPVVLPPPIVKPPPTKTPFSPPSPPPLTYPPPGPETCPVDALKLKLEGFAEVLEGLIHVGIGSKDACYLVLQGLTDLDAALCLCPTIKLKLLDINFVLPTALQVLLECGKYPPAGFKCLA